MKSYLANIFIGAAALASLFLAPLYATEVHVSSMAALQTAINSASAGDTIVLADGTYSNATLTIGKSNIVVRAATPGGVYLNGTQSITITGSYVTFSGFQFTSGNIGASNLIEVDGSHDIVTQCNVSGYKAGKYIRIKDGTQYNEISYCNIQNKDTSAITIGCAIQVSTSPTVPGYHKIRYCSFRSFPGLGGDFGNEPIRIGLSTERDNASRTTVEYCYFDDVGLGDSESISVKCCENVIRFCTFSNNPAGMLVFRNGDRNVAYGNFFLNGSGGIRCKEARKIWCYNNYFETAGISTVMDPVTLLYDNTGGYGLDSINFIHNTFVDCGKIELGGTGPTHVTFANNIFKKTTGSIFNNPNTGTTWAGNIRNGNLGITISSGMTNTDPKLVLNADNYYGLSATSPAINAANASYPAILDIANIDDDPTLSFDISGQARPATVTQKDVGCDEYTTGTTTNRPLTLADVGPSYLGGPAPVPVELANFTALLQNNTGAMLRWSTASEVRNAGFSVERRSAGASDWTAIGFVAGSGTSNTPKFYSYLDAGLVPGLYFYRIKQIDVDGSSTYSASMQVDAGISTGFELLPNYPNPFNPRTTIRFSVPEEGYVTLKVYNMLGQEVADLFSGTAHPGHFIPVTFDGSGLSSGQYVVRLSSAGRQLIQAMALTK